MKHEAWVQEFDQYWKQVEPHLICPSSEQRRFRDEAYRSVLEFFSDCPEEERPSVASYLGEPESLASTLLETLDAGEVQKTHRKNKRKTRIALIAGAACILVGGVLTYFYHYPLWVTVEETTTITEYPEGVEPPPPREDANVHPKDDTTYVFNGDTQEWEEYDKSSHVWDDEKGAWTRK